MLISYALQQFSLAFTWAKLYLHTLSLHNNTRIFDRMRLSP